MALIVPFYILQVIIIPFNMSAYYNNTHLLQVYLVTFRSTY